MRVEVGRLILSTGKEIYCYGEKVGLDIGASGHDGLVTYGSDGVINTIFDRWVDSDDADDVAGALTKEECKELAEHMIAAWQAYRDAL